MAKLSTDELSMFSENDLIELSEFVKQLEEVFQRDRCCSGCRCRSWCTGGWRRRRWRC